MLDRIKKVIEKEKMIPSTFADYIGISRASMNHVLNGRNNPSLEFLTKILDKFEGLNTDWLLFGKLPMYKGEKAFIEPSLFDDVPSNEDNPPKVSKYPKEMEEKTAEIPIKTIQNQIINPPISTEKKINKILILYTDNTFTWLTPEK